ncbi:MAG TPA: putative colanic acid biosynthesis acetyltransferase [Phycisphaerales bacterium]|nr:putative colanic acid biosynthesis acetyltransferase [Phycisphaerales bacterium]
MRFVWAGAWLVFFRWSPRPMHAWRNMLLRLFGAKLHPTARVYPRVIIWCPSRLKMGRDSCVGDDVEIYNVGGVEIGDHAVVSQYAYLCGATHDHEDVNFALVSKPIVIGARAWIAADVFIMAGVTIGEGTVVGARSDVFKDLPPWQVCVGSPARPIKPRELTPADYGDEVSD